MKQPKRDLRRCGHCARKYHGALALNELGYYDAAAAPAISRRDHEPICMACAKAEALADYASMTDEQARVAVEQDKQEALRLPTGLFWGTMKYPSGGLDQYLKDWDAVYGPAKEVAT